LLLFSSVSSLPQTLKCVALKVYVKLFHVSTKLGHSSEKNNTHESV